MTERDLFAYRRAVDEYQRRTDELAEMCPKFYAASVSSITGLPRCTSSYSPDRLSGRIEEHEEYIKAWCEAISDMQKTREVLSRVSLALDTESERKFLFYRYVKGLSPQDVAQMLCRSRSSLFRDRKAILDRIATMPYPV